MNHLLLDIARRHSCQGGRYIERGAETHERESAQAHSAGV